ncbi:NAD-dependent epimerase/dehydratase family protein [Taibaiella helva]|uniref:NAD-dependent epimerase/dehydratase family protein n=1 Tax=Taibaiella helva TaxID=2301235 RepID=UPI000E5752C9|nr:NAD-dependent epimerase/dehydratase family protein [Taibaiella helva]
MMTVSITGSTGFVGNNLLPYLQSRGIQTLRLNLRKTEDLVIPRGSDAVIHLAGKAHDHKGVATADEYFRVNTELTKAAFKCFLASDAKLFIHFSTVAAVTDEHIDGVLREDAMPHPATPYGQSKLQAEQFLLEQELPQNKKIIILRPAMIHGPGDKGNLTLLYNIVSKNIPYPLGAFSNERSFLSVANLNFALEQILEQMDTIPSGIYNLVDDAPVSTMDIVNLIAAITGKKGKVWTLPKGMIRLAARIGDVLPLPLNTKRLAKLTGNYVVSNHKIKETLGITAFPVQAMNGLELTIRSFASV